MKQRGVEAALTSQQPLRLDRSSFQCVGSVFVTESSCPDVRRTKSENVVRRQGSVSSRGYGCPGSSQRRRNILDVLLVRPSRNRELRHCWFYKAGSASASRGVARFSTSTDSSLAGKYQGWTNFSTRSLNGKCHRQMNSTKVASSAAMQICRSQQRTASPKRTLPQTSNVHRGPISCMSPPFRRPNWFRFVRLFFFFVPLVCPWLL